MTDEEREAAIARLLLRAAECAPTSLLELICDKLVTDGGTLHKEQEEGGAPEWHR